MTPSGTAAHELLQPDFEALTDRYTGTRVRGGNAILFLPSGAESYSQRWALIEGARASIDIVSFSMMRDGTTRRLRDLLTAKIREGVRVRVIVDDAAAYSTLVGGYLRQLAAAGAEVIRYHLMFRRIFPEFSQGRPFHNFARILKFKLKRHFHEKYMVVDGKTAILGGINWGDKYAYGGLRP
jgi:phosphatidylserine/phosphatidylglycerophosphate/cardiolipin synthase-like enzyme